MPRPWYPVDSPGSIPGGLSLEDFFKHFATLEDYIEHMRPHFVGSVRQHDGTERSLQLHVLPSVTIANWDLSPAAPPASIAIAALRGVYKKKVSKQARAQKEARLVAEEHARRDALAQHEARERLAAALAALGHDSDSVSSGSSVGSQEVLHQPRLHGSKSMDLQAPINPQRTRPKSIELRAKSHVTQTVALPSPVIGHRSSPNDVEALTQLLTDAMTTAAGLVVTPAPNLALDKPVLLTRQHPAFPSDVSYYIRGARYDKRAMDTLPETKRWLCFIGAPAYNPNRWVMVPSGYPGYDIPLEMEQFNIMNTLESMTLASQKISGHTDGPTLWSEGSPITFVDHLMMVVAYMARSGCNLSSMYKNELMYLTVEAEQMYLIKEVFLSTANQAYCAVVGPADEFNLLLSFVRWLECIIKKFRSRDSRSIGVQALLDGLTIHIRNGAFDVARAWSEIKSYTAQILALRGQTIALRDRCCNQLDLTMKRVSQTLFDEFSALINTRQSIAQAMGRDPSPYELYEAQITAMKENGIALIAKPGPDDFLDDCYSDGYSDGYSTNYSA